MDVIFPIDENENSAGVALLKLTIPFMDLNGPKPLTFYVINIYKNGMFIFTQNVRDAIQDDKSYGSKEKLRAVGLLYFSNVENNFRLRKRKQFSFRKSGLENSDQSALMTHF